MYLLLINGSPKKDGNLAQLLNTIQEEARGRKAKAEIMNVHPVVEKQDQPFCRACSSPCAGVCYRDTELEELYERVKLADALVLGSPVYFGTVSAQLKAFWDKTRKLRTDKVMINKVGAAVSCGAARFGGQETTLKALYDMMLIQGMILVGDGQEEADAGHHGVCSQQPSEEDDFARKRALILTKRVLEVAQATEKLRKKE